MGLALCILSLVVCYLAGSRSLVAGLVTILGVGYVYGIARANVPDTFSHFFFDAGALGLYAALLSRKLTAAQKARVRPLIPWFELLIAWPVLVFFIPIQDALIQLVGLRGNIFLLPFLLIGARLEDEDRYDLALWVSVLNLIVFGVAVAEFFLGLERFFPHNNMTELIYISNDIANRTAHRIPSSFSSAHAYAGTMVMTIPLLAGALVQKHRQKWNGRLLIAAIGASLIGVFMTGARTHFIVATVTVIVLTFSLKSKFGYAVGWLIMLAAVGWVVSSNQRLQRFTTLNDRTAVTERIAGSVNMGFFELAAKYPFGNGLGGGGTSIPYFLQDRIQNPIGMENEYARIMLEQGIIGLCFWIAFIFWLFMQGSGPPSDSWFLGHRLAWLVSLAYFITGLLGIGLFTSVPQTCVFFMLIGWVGARQPKAVTEASVVQHLNNGATLNIQPSR